MMRSEADVAFEMRQSVEQANDKQRKLKSSTFWRRFDVKAKQPQVVERINRLLINQGIIVDVKSGEAFGKEKDDDWIVLTLEIKPPEPEEQTTTAIFPTSDWFKDIQEKVFESEREVETFFIAPLLEKLGYDYDDFVIGYAVEMFKGVQRIKAEADFVLFNGLSREKKDSLLLIEAKKSNKAITPDYIGQARSYAQEIMPAFYIITNGVQVKVFKFNGMLAPDTQVMDFTQSMLAEKWDELYRYISKEAAINRKNWMLHNSDANNHKEP
jgi:hypothetical protein